MATEKKKGALSQWFNNQAEMADKQSKRLSDASNNISKSGNSLMGAGCFLFFVLFAIIYFCTCR